MQIKAGEGLGFSAFYELSLSIHSSQELFSINHHLLNAIGVGHPSLDKACAIAQQFGLGAKLTGGGGGGCAIALIPPGKLVVLRVGF